jgi:hypothetical protein
VNNGTTQSYPLHWPDGFPRTPSGQREFGHLKLSLEVSMNSLREELRMLGATDVILSTNVPTRRDGNPYASGYGRVGDPGAAVYFVWKKAPRVMACDRYDEVRKNVRALALCIEAMRALSRHGVSEMLDRAFRGFTALPAQGGAASWSEVLGVPSDASRDEVHEAYRRRSLECHPDRGGSHDAMARVNQAWAEAQADLGVGAA